MQRSSSFFWNCENLNDEDVDGDDNADPVINALEQINEYSDSVTVLSTEEEEEYNGDIYLRPITSPQSQKKKYHVNNQETRPIMSSHSSPPLQYNSINSTTSAQTQSIRFQVVVWYVGPIDVKLGHVPVRFRVTLFWNDVPVYNQSPHDRNKVTPTDWIMQGRRTAIQKERHDSGLEVIDVPPISILNAVQFEIIGSPEVNQVNHHTRLMRWTCLYNATLFQENMRVDKFPHDEHEITIQLGIVADRHYNRRWDCRIWKLALATEADSQGSTRIPHGLLIDNASIPDFIRSSEELIFEFVSSQFGPTNHDNHDVTLQVKIPVFRESGHYDKNIMPLMAVLNLVAITCLTRNFAGSTASTELVLSIAFVEIGIRLSIDSRLPSVGYQIKLQRILNQCFWLLLLLVLESNLAYHLVFNRGWSVESTYNIDILTAFIGFMHTFFIVYLYYIDLVGLGKHTTVTDHYKY